MAKLLWLCALLLLASAAPAGAQTGDRALARTGMRVPRPAGRAVAVRGAELTTDSSERPQFKDKGVLPFGDTHFFGSPTGTALGGPVVAMASTPDGNGYWLAAANGSVFAYGDAGHYGGAQELHLQGPVIGMATTVGGLGYWLVTMDGAAYSFGDARYYGSLAPGKTRYPVVGFSATPDGDGYWMVTSHGQVYGFGDAHLYGSLGGTNLHSIPVVAIASSVDGRGYWLVQGGGEVVPYGDAPRLGGMRGHPPVSGIAVTSDGQGYWLVCGNGEVDAFGDAQYYGGNDNAVPRPPITAIVAGPDDEGYWLLDSEAFSVSFTGTGSQSAGVPRRRAQIVAAAASQLGPSPDGGGFCNPYGPCEEWCALFATWAWESAGVRIPRYAFVGDVYYWAARHTKVVPVSTRPAPGDLVLYGTGPKNVSTSPHMGVVAQVWPDGAIDTVEGDAGPGPGGWTSVLVNGPFLPSQSYFANGMPIYAFALP